MRRVAALDLALILAIGLFWGLNWPAVKVILGALPPFTLRACAFLAATPLLVLLARLNGERLWPRRGEILPLGLAGWLSVLLFNLLAAYGQLLTETSKAAIVAFTMPLWASLLSCWLLGERLAAATLVALALGMAGLLLLVGEDLAGFLAAPAGILVMLASAISWALGTVLLKARAWSLGPIARAAWMLGVSAPPVVLLALALDRPWELAPPSAGIALVFAYHVVFPMVACYAAWVLLVGRLPASVAAIGTLLVPVIGVLSAAWLLGETLAWQRLLALLLVLSSILLALRVPLPSGRLRR